MWAVLQNRTLGRRHRPASSVCVEAAVGELRGGREATALNEVAVAVNEVLTQSAKPTLLSLQWTRPQAGRRGRG